MSRNVGFRGWFYFRQGWSVYFAFIFAAINTLTVTYFLAIENYPFLKEIFPSFFHYIVIVVTVGIPCLILIGYAHYKRTPSFKAEADIQVEANPHFRRTLINTELMLAMFLEISQLTIKLSNNEKLTDEEVKRLKNLQDEFQEQIKNRVIKD
tara:strand:+ start:23748 stop:24203 length:456 start_codon:yes stop_codon:yes gene_type:complete